MELRRRDIHKKKILKQGKPNQFDYSLDFKNLDLRENSDLYRVGVGEQGVLLVEPYKSEILPHWKFAQPHVAEMSAKAISQLFAKYLKNEDFVGMDMARKFLQMGYTRSRRYANHRSGQKYFDNGEIKPFDNDPIKAQSAEIFFKAWKTVEENPIYSDLKLYWKFAFG